MGTTVKSTTGFRSYPPAALALILLSGLASLAAGQPPDVAISPIVETDAVHPGTTARVALAVTLDTGFHVNSNTPLDDLLIPTVLMLDPPAGISLEGVAFPEAILLEQVGAEQPLAVFEEEFLIGAALTLDAALSPGSYAVPGTLRYQACNERMCFNPTNAQIQFELTVAPTTQSLTTVHSDLFAGLTLVDPAADNPAPASGAPALDDLSLLSALEEFEVLSSTGGFLDTERLSPLHGGGRIRRRRTGMVRGTRSACDPGAHPAGRPRAEPDAVRAPNDPDQLGDHRRRYEGRLPDARLRAGWRLWSRDGARLRHSGPGGHPDRRHLRDDQLLPLVQLRHRGTVRRARAGDV